MEKIKKHKTLSLVALPLMFLFLGVLFPLFKSEKTTAQVPLQFSDVQNKMIGSGDSWPNEIQVDDRSFDIVYTFDQDLTNYIKKVLKSYRSDFSSIVVIDNSDGKILAAVDYTRTTKKFGKTLTMSNTHPAASIFKIVTAADLFENSNFDPMSTIDYVGRRSTLYKWQLKKKRNRWMRTETFKKAFAYSNNVAFGKAAIEHITPMSLFNTAERLGFGQSLMKEYDLEDGG